MNTTTRFRDVPYTHIASCLLPGAKDNWERWRGKNVQVVHYLRRLTGVSPLCEGPWWRTNLLTIHTHKRLILCAHLIEID